MQQKSELPEGWSWAEINQLGDLINGDRGKNYPSKKDYVDNGIPFINAGHLLNGKILIENTDFITEEKYNSLRSGKLAKGDIIYCLRGKLGKCAIFSGIKTGAIASSLVILRLNEKVDNIYIYYFLISPFGRELIKLFDNGTAQPNLSAKSLSNYLVPLPPLVEQHRIVSAIEAFFSRLDMTNEKLDRVPEILKKFRQSVLAAAIEGKLTEDWRKKNLDIETGSFLIDKMKKNHELEGKGHGGKAAPPTEGIHKIDFYNVPLSWGVTELKWLCKPGRSITYGILKPGPDQLNGVPYIRVADFPNDSIVLDGVKRTTNEIANNYRRSSLNTGDILLSIRGTVGRVCCVPEELQGANLTQDTARISVHEEIDADFIVLYLRSPSLQKVLEKAIKGVAIRGVNIGDVRALQILLPPLPEQQEIVRRVNALFAFADSIKSKVTAAREKTEKLKQSILSKAFSGELVETEAELARREGRD